MKQAALQELRENLGLSQTEMAEELGLSLSEYQDIESNSSLLRKLHILAAERLALTVIARTGELKFLPFAVMTDSIAMKRVIDNVAKGAASTRSASRKATLH